MHTIIVIIYLLLCGGCYFFMFNITESILEPTPYQNYIEIIYLLAIIPISFISPVKYAWENGPIENTQAFILLISCLTNIYFYLKSHKKLWLTATLFFFFY